MVGGVLSVYMSGILLSLIWRGDTPWKTQPMPPPSEKKKNAEEGKRIRLCLEPNSIMCMHSRVSHLHLFVLFYFLTSPLRTFFYILPFFVHLPSLVFTWISYHWYYLRTVFACTYKTSANIVIFQHECLFPSVFIIVTHCFFFFIIFGFWNCTWWWWWWCLHRWAHMPVSFRANLIIIRQSRHALRCIIYTGRKQVKKKRDTVFRCPPHFFIIPPSLNMYLVLWKTTHKAHEVNNN